MNVEYQLNFFGNPCGNGRDREIEQITSCMIDDPYSEWIGSKLHIYESAFASTILIQKKHRVVLQNSFVLGSLQILVSVTQSLTTYYKTQ